MRVSVRVSIIFGVMFVLCLVCLADSSYGAQDRVINEVRVYAKDRKWLDTSLHFSPGDTIEISATGEVVGCRGCPRNKPGHGMGKSNAGGRFLAPNIPGHDLVGKIGRDGRPFIIGESYSDRAGHGGVLYLAHNDDDYWDNSGYYNVRIVKIAKGNNHPNNGGAKHQSKTVFVESRKLWNPTGIYLQHGQAYRISASGKVDWNPWTKPVTPNGYGKTARGDYMLSGVNQACLIGRIGNGPIFYVGSQFSGKAHSRGELFLGINEGIFECNRNDRCHNDNSGAWTAEISTR